MSKRRRKSNPEKQLLRTLVSITPNRSFPKSPPSHSDNASDMSSKNIHSSQFSSFSVNIANPKSSSSSSAQIAQSTIVNTKPNQNISVTINSLSPFASMSKKVALTGQGCSNCGTTRTPLWRRAPDGSIICNACGLYLKARNTARPVNLKRPPQTTTIILEGPSVSGKTQSQGLTSSESRLVANATGNAPAPAELSQSVRAAMTCADNDLKIGSCPGDGHCNGTGGSTACSGCPAYNNRVTKAVQLAVAMSNNWPLNKTTKTLMMRGPDAHLRTSRHLFLLVSMTRAQLSLHAKTVVLLLLPYGAVMTLATLSAMPAVFTIDYMVSTALWV